MSKYRVLVTDSNEFIASFDSYYKAEECAMQFVETTGKETCLMEVISTHKPVIDSYEAATAYLGGDAKNHQKAIIALEKLIVIAEAWNKADEFVPDFDNTNQYKWFPWFRKNGTAGFVCESTFTTATSARASFGSRLCFISDARAKQFGTQFIDLWNDFLLYR